MAAWNYPGKQRRGQKNLQCTEPRWSRPAWKSLAWVAQLLAALDLSLIVFVRAPGIGNAIWWCVLGISALLLLLVSVLAVR